MMPLHYMRSCCLQLEGGQARASSLFEPLDYMRSCCLRLEGGPARASSLFTGNQDSLAEWSKALASGAGPQGRGFEPHSCHCGGGLDPAAIDRGHDLTANLRAAKGCSGN